MSERTYEYLWQTIINELNKIERMPDPKSEKELFIQVARDNFISSLRRILAENKPLPRYTH